MKPFFFGQQPQPSQEIEPQTHPWFAEGKSNRDTSSSDMDLIPMKEDVRGKWFDRNTHQRNDPKR